MCELNLALTALSSVSLTILKCFKVLLMHLSYLLRDLLGGGKHNWGEEHGGCH